jgi:hypothetical protein
VDIHLTVQPQDHIHLFVNGALVDEIAGGVTETRDTLQAEVSQARCLQTLARWLARLPALLEAIVTKPDHAHKTLEQRQAAALRGLRDGLQGTTRPYPGVQDLTMPALPPEGSETYRRAWKIGDGYRRALAGSGEGEA